MGVSPNDAITPGQQPKSVLAQDPLTWVGHADSHRYSYSNSYSNSSTHCYTRAYFQPNQYKYADTDFQPNRNSRSFAKSDIFSHPDEYTNGYPVPNSRTNSHA